VVITTEWLRALQAIRSRHPMPLQSKTHREDFIRFGGHSVSKTPDPIPNSAVKCYCANGTAS
jgi:hypothetical protein